MSQYVPCGHSECDEHLVVNGAVERAGGLGGGEPDASTLIPKHDKSTTRSATSIRSDARSCFVNGEMHIVVAGLLCLSGGSAVSLG